VIEQSSAHQSLDLDRTVHIGLRGLAVRLGNVFSGIEAQDAIGHVGRHLEDGRAMGARHTIYGGALVAERGGERA